MKQFSFAFTLAFSVFALSRIHSSWADESAGPYACPEQTTLALSCVRTQKISPAYSGMVPLKLLLCAGDEAYHLVQNYEGMPGNEGAELPFTIKLIQNRTKEIPASYVQLAIAPEMSEEQPLLAFTANLKQGVIVLPFGHQVNLISMRCSKN